MLHPLSPSKMTERAGLTGQARLLHKVLALPSTEFLFSSTLPKGPEHPTHRDQGARQGEECEE